MKQKGMVPQSLVDDGGHEVIRAGRMVLWTEIVPLVHMLKL